MMFLIYKTALELLRSPQFYLVVLLIIGISVLFDMLYIVITREWETPVYLMFKSLMQKKELSMEEKLNFGCLIKGHRYFS